MRAQDALRPDPPTYNSEDSIRERAATRRRIEISDQRLLALWRSLDDRRRARVEALIAVLSLLFALALILRGFDR